MKKNLFNEINKLIHKKETLSPTEKSSLSTLLQDLEDELYDNDIIAKELYKSEDKLPGLHSEHSKTTDHKIGLYQQKIITMIRNFKTAHPDLVEAIDSLCTTLSNMGI